MTWHLSCYYFQQCSPDSLFDSDDCVLTDVNLSEASEAGLLLADYNKFSYNSLNSDGDSYPNSPINGKRPTRPVLENVMSCAAKKVNYNLYSTQHFAECKTVAFITDAATLELLTSKSTSLDQLEKTSVKYILYCLHAKLSILILIPY